MKITHIIDRVKLLFQSERELRLALHDILGFYPHDIQYYRVALKHRSLHDGENNERLEFLGDAILDAVVGDIVYRHFPKADEGRLTQIRSRIVSRESLGKLSHDIGLVRLVRSNLQTNSAHNSYMAGNAFEALVGALYLDQGYRRCMSFVERRILPLMQNIDDLMKQDDNHKSRLLEWTQKRHITLRFDITQHPDPDPKKSSPIFVATVFMNDVEMGTGSGYSKKQAGQEAAKTTLEMLKNPKVRSRLKREKES